MRHSKKHGLREREKERKRGRERERDKESNMDREREIESQKEKNRHRNSMLLTRTNRLMEIFFPFSSKYKTETNLSNNKE